MLVIKLVTIFPKVSLNSHKLCVSYDIEMCSLTVLKARRPEGSPQYGHFASEDSKGKLSLPLEVLGDTACSWLVAAQLELPVLVSLCSLLLFPLLLPSCL